MPMFSNLTLNNSAKSANVFKNGFTPKYFLHLCHQGILNQSWNKKQLFFFSQGMYAEGPILFSWW